MAIESNICNFGWKALDFKLKSIDDKDYALKDLIGTNGTLIMFICNHCPYVKAVAKKISFETKQLKALNINSIAIMSNDTSEYPEDSFNNMKLFAEKNKFEFPYLIDETQEVAKKYKAQCTPDFFGFNKNLELHYRGRLDSSGRNNENIEIKRELYLAMKQISLTNQGPNEQLPSIGCSIKWRK